MKDFLEKVDAFLFDFLGLIIPGTMFLILLAFPIYLVDFSQVPADYDKPLLIFLNGLANRLFLIFSDNPDSYIIILFVLAAYIIGHVIKVFSKLQYDLAALLFDDLLIKFVFRGKLVKFVFRGKLVKLEKNIIIQFLLKYSEKLFLFRPLDFSKNTENIKSYILKNIQEQNPDFSDNWHDVYKYSRILITQENIRSLYYGFLSRYNFYRSISFLFLVNLFYELYIFKNYKTFFYNDLSRSVPLIVAINLLLWFTFHDKYKRYWTLCGNEAIMDAYYYLTKKKSRYEEQNSLS